jgi:hypothetical protein
MSLVRLLHSGASNGLRRFEFGVRAGRSLPGLIKNTLQDRLKPVRAWLERHMDYRNSSLAPLLCALLITSACNEAAPTGDFGAPPGGGASAPSIPTTEKEPTEVLWGDLHLHTAWSFDAFVFTTTATPDDAFNFAKGGALAHPAGGVYQLDRPLDFLAVTDHSEFVGVVNAAADPTNPLSTVAVAANLLNPNPLISGQAFLAMGAAIRDSNKDYFTPERAASDQASVDTWTRTVNIANRQNVPGKFTALIAYEWTGAQQGGEIHRNIIYRGDTGPLPFTSMDSNRPEDLWNFLEGNRQAGRGVLAIPHNPNISNGQMFGTTDSFGQKMTAAYVETRSRNEPVVEITQTKGTSEAHPSLSPNDEFANFELMETFPGSTTPITKFAGGYVRDALKTGLAMQDGDGFNPYRFGVIGGTDSHLAMSPVIEKNYFGTTGNRDGTAKLRMDCTYCAAGSDFRKFSSSGLTAVWAPENTRGAVYDALHRKETYATTGPRIKVRFFGGLEMWKNLAGVDGWVSRAYRDGVPMGGTLGRLPPGRAPSFALWALKDPDGANLDRIQVVKVWAKRGVTHEAVFDVALSGQRQRDPRTGKAEPVGNTVNAATATYTNTIGAAVLAVNWTDPTFDPDAPAAYYVRVLEIPTPRWSTYDSVRLGRAVPADLPVSIQERAFTSAIWYDPTRR